MSDSSKNFNYFTVEESEQFAFYRIPKILFTEKQFDCLSTSAKVLYGLLLDRIGLSKRNGWVDKQGRVYIIFTVDEAKDFLKMSRTTITKLFRELDSENGIGLIERKKQGNNRPSLIYVKNFNHTIVEKKESSDTLENIQRDGQTNFGHPKTGRPESEHPESEQSDDQNLILRTTNYLTSGQPEFNPPDDKNLVGINTDNNNTDYSDTEKSENEKSRFSLAHQNPYHVYGRFKNVRLLDAEFLELQRYYPRTHKQLIEQLSSYMASSGRKYESHFATLCLWGDRENAKNPVPVRSYEYEEGESL